MENGYDLSGRKLGECFFLSIHFVNIRQQSSSSSGMGQTFLGFFFFFLFFSALFYLHQRKCGEKYIFIIHSYTYYFINIKFSFRSKNKSLINLLRAHFVSMQWAHQTLCPLCVFFSFGLIFKLLHKRYMYILPFYIDWWMQHFWTEKKNTIHWARIQCVV